MIKYILQLALETNLDLFNLEDKIKSMFLEEINKETFSNHIIVKMIQYEGIEDCFYELKGINNHSGGGFHIYDKTKPVIEIEEEKQ